MSGINFARLTYTTNNLGDDIQTVATLPFLQHTSYAFNRDTLALQQSDKKYIILMNAWWAAVPENAFPPAECFIPVFIGFHLTQSSVAYFSQPHCIDYLKANAPIGCRDIATATILKRWGIETFFSGCLTTTFERRDKTPDAGKVFLVDTERIDFLIPVALKKGAKRLSHHYEGDPSLREETVHHLLSEYRNSASLVITTRLHAALTCSSMGIPVVFFFHPRDPRATTAEQIGLRMHKYFLKQPRWVKKGLIRFRIAFLWVWVERILFWTRYTFFQKIEWHPQPLSFDGHKNNLINKTREIIQTQLKRFS
jgi:Polysaccharide pyruvyl transferase